MLLLKQGGAVDIGGWYLFWREEGWLNYGPQMQKDIKTKITLWKRLEIAVTYEVNIVKSKCSEKWVGSNLG